MPACSIPIEYLREICIVCLHVHFPKDMCTTFDLYRICAGIFNSRRICAQDLHSNFLTCIGFCACMFNSCWICARILCYMGLVLAYSILGGYVHHSNLYKICACILDSYRICAQDLHSDFLDYFWMKDPLGCWRTHWGV